MSKPSAIRWLVVAVYIFAINLSAAEVCRAHVIDESVKGFPSIADRDATTAVFLVSRGLGVVAARPHGIPFAIEHGSVKSVLCSNTFLLTATACSSSRLHAVDQRDVREFSAVTSAYSHVLIGAWFFANSFHSEKTEFLANFDRIGFMRNQIVISNVHISSIQYLTSES